MFQIKKVDNIGFMNRFKALAGIKRGQPNSSSIFIDSRKFLKQLEIQFDKFESKFKKEKVIDQVYKYINSKRNDYFFCLKEYQDANGWDQTIMLLAQPGVANKVLKKLVDKKDNELKESKNQSSLEEHNPSEEEIREVEGIEEREQEEL